MISLTIWDFYSWLDIYVQKQKISLVTHEELKKISRPSLETPVGSSWYPFLFFLGVMSASALEFLICWFRLGPAARQSGLLLDYFHSPNADLHIRPILSPPPESAWETTVPPIQLLSVFWHCREVMFDLLDTVPLSKPRLPSPHTSGTCTVTVEGKPERKERAGRFVKDTAKSDCTSHSFLTVVCFKCFNCGNVVRSTCQHAMKPGCLGLVKIFSTYVFSCKILRLDSFRFIFFVFRGGEFLVLLVNVN